MAISLVRTVTATATGAASVTIGMGAASAAGNALIVTPYGGCSTNAALTVTSSVGGTTFAKAAGAAILGGFGDPNYVRTEIWAALNVPAGTHSITVNAGSGQSFWGYATGSEFSGVGTASSVDQTAAQAWDYQVYGQTQSVTTGTTTAASELVVAASGALDVIGYGQNSGLSTPAGYTAVSSVVDIPNWNAGYVLAYKTISSTGAQTANFGDLTSGMAGAVAVATFKAGSTYADTRADSAAATDTRTAAATVRPSRAETAAASDAVSGGFTQDGTRAESAAATDTVTGAVYVSNTQTVTLTTTGAGSWPIPSGIINSLDLVEVWGAGGGGAKNTNTRRAAGGGGGGYSAVANLPVTPGGTLYYSIGAGGGGASSTGSSGSAGGSSWANAQSNAAPSSTAQGPLAAGGAGGGAINSGTATGGAGGATGSGIGGTKYAGGAGGNASGSGSAAGGGGAASNAGAGNAASTVSGSATAGAGAAAGTGGGTGGAINTAGTPDVDGGGGGGGTVGTGGGGAGGAPAGGGGAVANSTGTAGAGGRGQVRITYTSYTLKEDAGGSVADSAAAAAAATNSLIATIARAESTAATDTATAATTLATSRADASSATDSAIAVPTFGLARAESSAASDAILGGKLYSSSVSDTAAAADTVTGDKSSTVFDSVSASQRFGPGYGSVLDELSNSSGPANSSGPCNSSGIDAGYPFLEMPVSRADAAVVADSIIPGLAVTTSRAESAAAADANTGVRATAGSLEGEANSAEASDGPTLDFITFGATASDAAAASDIISVQVTCDDSVADEASSGEAYSFVENGFAADTAATSVTLAAAFAVRPTLEEAPVVASDSVEGRIVYPGAVTADLLPRTSTEFERALARASDAGLPLPVPIRELWNPWTCPLRLLPWLAWALSVDIWDDAWPEPKKRLVVATSLARVRRKGTPAGLKEYVSLVGGRVVRAITPPSKLFLMPALTAAEYERFLAMMPQLRTFPYRHRGFAHGGAYTANARVNERDRMFPSLDCFVFPSDAPLRRGRRTYWWDRGEEVECQRLERETLGEDGKLAYDFETTFIPAKAPYTLFPGPEELGGRLGVRMFLPPADAISRTISTRIERIYNDPGNDRLTLKAVPMGTGLDPVNVRPRWVAQRGTAAAGFFPSAKGAGGLQCIGGAMPITTAGERLYERLYLHDPSRLPERRPRTTHLGFVRLGMPPYHAEALVEAPGKRSQYATGQFIAGYFVASDAPIRVGRMAEAGRLAKATRDKLLIDTAAHRPATVGDRIKVGVNAKVGSLVRR